MTQRFFITLACFAIPFLLYALYERQRRRTAGKEQWPLFILWMTGAVMAVETLALAALSQKGLPEGRYVPAQLEDGRIIPPHVIPTPEKK